MIRCALRKRAASSKSDARTHAPRHTTPRLLKLTIVSGIAAGVGGMILLSSLGVILPWAGRFYSLWDTGYAKIHIPIIASVSEHQPTPWTSFFFDLQMLVPMIPVGIWCCFQVLSRSLARGSHTCVVLCDSGLAANAWRPKSSDVRNPTYDACKPTTPMVHPASQWKTWLTSSLTTFAHNYKQNLTDENVFIILYGVTAVYFAGVMVRLMLTLTPVTCILAAVGFSYILDTYLQRNKAGAKTVKPYVFFLPFSLPRFGDRLPRMVPEYITHTVVHAVRLLLRS